MQEDLYTPNSVRTFTGRYINLVDPQPETIFPFDIAIGLARAARFAGHTKKFYSVAQHSDWCRQQCELQYPGNDSLAFKMLLHDAHEFILCDLPSPVKSLLPGYEMIAAKLQNAIHVRFGIKVTPLDNSIIKDIDNRALIYEWNNYVLRNCTGLALMDRDNADIFIHHFVRLCKVPHVLQ
jgi:5'-deoxynucleotidase YfbR-like HD superfamily hydrolase